MGDEDEVDDAQDRGGGAEGIVERERDEFLADPGEVGGEMVLHAVEGLGLGPLEGVDRLLEVAHDEDGPFAVGVGADAGGEFLGEAGDDLPLQGRGVLRFVHEDVIDAAVEFEEDPLRHHGVGQERAGAPDEVVEVHKAAGGLGGVERGEEGPSEGVKVERAGERDQREARAARSLDPGHERVDAVDQRGVALAGGAGGDRADLGGEGVVLLGTLAMEEDVLKHLEIGEGWGKSGQEVREPCGELHIVGRAVAAKCGEAGEIGGRIGVKDIGKQALFGRPGREAEGAADRGRVGRGGEGIAAGGDTPQEGVEILARKAARDGGEGGGPGPLGDGIDDLGPQEGGGAVVHLGKGGADAAFEREAAQKARAEGVDGLDAQAAWHFERLGEETAGAAQVLWAEIGAEIGEFGQERGVGLHRPGAEALKEAVLHLGRGGLGIGEAEDVGGADAGEKEAGDAVGEHARLARAGIGGDPGGAGGIGGLNLAQGGGVAGHPTSSGVGSVVWSHSPKRARWSYLPASVVWRGARRDV